jgi:hypothetical protein
MESRVEHRDGTRVGQGWGFVGMSSRISIAEQQRSKLEKVAPPSQRFMGGPGRFVIHVLDAGPVKLSGETGNAW